MASDQGKQPVLKTGAGGACVWVDTKAHASSTSTSAICDPSNCSPENCLAVTGDSTCLSVEALI